LLALCKTGKLLALIFLITGFMHVNGSYKHKAGDVVVVAELKDSLIVEDLAGFALEAQSINEKFYSHPLQNIIYVYLTDSESEYHKFSNTKIPEWSSGVAFISQHIIVLKPGQYYNPVRYRETMIHEISHIYMGELSNMRNRLPVWLNEGTAMYLSGKSLSWEENIVLGNALAANKLLDLTAIDSLLAFKTAEANLAYLESFLAIQFIVEQHGEKKLSEIILSLSKHGSLDQIFLEILGYDFFDFELKWFDNFKSQFRWIAFLQFENLFFMTLVIIIFLALVMRRYRNKKIYQRWEEEDLESL